MGRPRLLLQMNPHLQMFCLCVTEALHSGPGLTSMSPHNTNSIDTHSMRASIPIAIK